MKSRYGTYRQCNRFDQKYDEITIYNTMRPEAEAVFAMLIIERWAVQALPDGEDSVGRAKNKLTPLPDVVKRACDISELAFQEFKKRGWLFDVPAPRKIKPKDEGSTDG